MTAIVLTIPGKPRGKGRPKFTRRGNHVATYTDDKTAGAEETIKAVWREQGCTRLPEGPLELTIRVIHERPKTHYLKNGELSKEGCRQPVPTRKPDGDNVMKLVADALNGLAYRDDAQIAHWDLRAEWGLRARTLIDLRPLPSLRW